jgi:hypothetical protein
MNSKSAIVLLCGLSFFAAAGPEIQAQAGSNVVMMVNVPATLEKTIDGKKSKAGDAVTAKVSAVTQLNDGTKVPAGSVLVGHIDSVTASENKGDSTAVVTFDKLQIKGGNELAVKATVISVSSLLPSFGNEDKPYDPSSYKPGSMGDNKTNGSNNQGSGSTAPHPIDGLTLSGTPKDATSATLTQAKKNVHLSSGVQLVVSVAPLPSGAASH